MTGDTAKEGSDAGDGEIELRSGAVRVRPASRELEVGGEPVAIERRAFDLLVHLMRNADRVVDKDELLREVWHSRPVSESTLAQAASRVRKALGGEPDQWVATVYGVGYRFVGEVTTAEPAAGKSGDPEGVFPQGRSRWTRLALVPGLAVVLVALLVAAWMTVREPAVSELRIAVLPVQNETGDARLDWVELGVLPLIDRALEDGGVRRVQTGQVLSTLRRYPEAQDSASQARVLKLATSADRVLIPRLFVADGGYRFEVRSAGTAAEADAGRYSLDLQGDDVAVLAVAAGTSLSESLSRWQGARRARSGFVTDDAFVNEAFMRGLDARLRGQWAEAARFFDTVLAAAPELLDAKYHLALVTRRLGDWDYTEQLHAELLEAARERGDDGMLATVQSVSGTLAWRRGDRDRAEALYTQALEKFGEQGNADYVANALGNLGILAATRGEFALAEERMRESLKHYREVGDRFNEATALKNLGNLLVDQGRYDDAEQVLLESLRIRRELELPVHVAMTLSTLGDVEMARGNWSQALAYQERVLEAAEAHETPTLGIQARSDVSAALRRLGRLEEAVTSAAEAYARATELGSPSNQAFALLQQGRAELDRQRPAGAESLFERAADIYAEIDQPLGELSARIARVRALIDGEHLEAAEQALVEVRARLETSEIRRLDVAMARAEARLAFANGEPRRALDRLEAAYRTARGAQTPIEMVDTGGALGLALLDEAGDGARAAALADQLSAGADASEAALKFLARFHAPTDPAQALALAERRRDLVGEGWTPEDERELRELRERAGTSR